MYVDKDVALKLKLAPLPVDIERGQLRLFAKAIGETSLIYTDVAAAHAAGYPDLPAPPSFLGNAIELDIPNPLHWLQAVGVDINNTLHGEQAFTYHKMAFAGDKLIFHRRICDVFTKKEGKLEFIVKESRIMRGDELIAEAFCSIVAMHQENKE